MSCGPHCLSEPAVQCSHLSTRLGLSLIAFLLDTAGHIQLQGRFFFFPPSRSSIHTLHKVLLSFSRFEGTLPSQVRDVAE